MPQEFEGKSLSGHVHSLEALAFYTVSNRWLVRPRWNVQCHSLVTNLALNMRIDRITIGNFKYGSM